MNTKTLLIPIAAFALSATGVSAFNGDLLQKAGLTEDQISAFSIARELRDEGDRDKARDVLLEAGIDQDTLESVRKTMHEERENKHTAMKQAIEANDFDAFKIAIADSPLADIITSEADFKLFIEAHEYREDGDFEAAKAIMDDLGFDGFGQGHHAFQGKGWVHKGHMMRSEKGD